MVNLKKAVFLDRDGVINKEKNDYVKTIDELEIFPEIGSFIKQIKDLGYLVIVITNQSAINRGLTTNQKVEEIHNKIQDFLKTFDTSIDRFYYCPHRPDENCDCRKPNPGLFLKAASDLNIDLKLSWMIGDSLTDILAANTAGCYALKIDENNNLTNALNRILNSKISQY